MRLLSNIKGILKMVKREMFFNDNVVEVMKVLNNFIESNFITNVINIVEYRGSLEEYKIVLFYKEKTDE